MRTDPTTGANRDGTWTRPTSSARMRSNMMGTRNDSYAVRDNRIASYCDLLRAVKRAMTTHIHVVAKRKSKAFENYKSSSHIHIMTGFCAECAEESSAQSPGDRIVQK